MTRPALQALFRLSVLPVLPIAMAGCIHSATYGTGESPEVAMFREMSGGLLNKNQKKEPIEYQPRAPLVMPAAADQLPPPAETAAAASPDWPVDRDQLKATADARADDGDPRNDINPDEYRRLKPLQGVFPEQKEETFVSEDTGHDDYYKTIVHGKEQRVAFQKAVADSKGFGNDDERRYLTDPPVAYRQPVAGADGAVALPEEKPKGGNFLTRWWHRS